MDEQRIMTMAVQPRAGADGAVVTITCATTGATIYYTTDGIDPTESSTRYDAPFNVYKDCTVKAIAIKTGLLDSLVATEEVDVTLPVPQLSFAAGATSDVGTVTITNVASYSDFGDVKFYYTTDGSAPSASSAETTGTINVSANGTVKVVAIVGEEVSSAGSVEVSTLKVQTPVISIA